MGGGSGGGRAEIRLGKAMDDGKRALTLQLNLMASASLERKLEGGGLSGGGRAAGRLGGAMDPIAYGCSRGVSGSCFLVFLKPFYSVS